MLAQKERSTPSLDKDFSKLDEREQGEFVKLKGETMAHYNNHWYEALADELYYKRPFMGNGELLKTVQHPEKE